MAITIRAFIAEFEDEHFPSSLGPPISFDAHDPAFTDADLIKMEKSGLIVVNWEKLTYQLTLKACEKRDTSRSLNLQKGN